MVEQTTSAEKDAVGREALTAAPGGDSLADAKELELVYEPPNGDDRDEQRFGAEDAASVPSTVFLRGVVIGERFQIEQCLGRLASGMVYRARDRSTGEVVAINVLHAERARERTWIKQLARMLKLVRIVRHPNVSRVFAFGHADGFWFVAMEPADPGTLEQFLHGGEAAGTPEAAARTRPLAERLDDLRAVCAGLAAFHAIGITHGDLTSRNILRTPDGRWVISDFGGAMASDDSERLPGVASDHPPPETARGERPDERSDVFQLGTVMHELLYGLRPVARPDGSGLVICAPPAAGTLLEWEVGTLIAACLDSDAARRPPTALAVAGRLAAAESARALTSILPERAVLHAQRFTHRHNRLVWLALAPACALALARVVQLQMHVSAHPRGLAPVSPLELVAFCVLGIAISLAAVSSFGLAARPSRARDRVPASPAPASLPTSDSEAGQPSPSFLADARRRPDM